MAIHEEWIANLLADRPHVTVDRLERTRTIMDQHFPEAVVSGYEVLIAKLDLPDVRDRHVLAAAIHGCASAIVTFNLRDFPADRLAPHGLEAQHPDDFIGGLLQSQPEAVLAAVRGHRAALRNPPRSTMEHLAALEKLGLGRTATVLSNHKDAI